MSLVLQSCVKRGYHYSLLSVLSLAVPPSSVCGQEQRLRRQPSRASSHSPSPSLPCMGLAFLHVHSSPSDEV